MEMKGGGEARAEPGGAQHLVPAERSTMRKATHRARPAMPRAPEAAFSSADKRVGKIDLEDSVVSKKTGPPCQEDLFELRTLYVTRPTSNNVAPKEQTIHAKLPPPGHDLPQAKSAPPSPWRGVAFSDFFRTYFKNVEKRQILLFIGLCIPPLTSRSYFWLPENSILFWAQHLTFLGIR